MNKKHIHKEDNHQDPHRFPKLTEPVEAEMLGYFAKTMNNIIVDVTKIMVKQAKNKK